MRPVCVVAWELLAYCDDVADAAASALSATEEVQHAVKGRVIVRWAVYLEKERQWGGAKLTSEVVQWWSIGYEPYWRSSALSAVPLVPIREIKWVRRGGWM